ncbi:MAG TPA: porin family protein [Puia sp.]|nr:porin family protein [Puia sp.]
MKKLLLGLLLSGPFCVFAQIGIKAGLNFANVTQASSINNGSKSGFMAGIFLAPHSKSILSSRTELIYSRQGYNFNTGANTGKVNLDYIVLPQLMGINITKYVQLQLGAQMAFLINAKADSTKGAGSMAGPYGAAMDYYNKFDYGFAAGAEIHPFKGMLIGARYNIGLGKLYKDAMNGQEPSFKIDTKSNIVQIFAGWTFGGQDQKKKGPVPEGK